LVSSLVLFAALAVTALAAQAADPYVGKVPVGLQMYSLRAEMAKDIPGTLDRMRNYGFKYVEVSSTGKLPPE
jgi:hypothetical protein